MSTCSLLNGFREILLNSINHKQYEENNPIQSSIYDDKMYVWNDGKFPDEIAKQDLFKKHYSKPYNPLIAQTFFKAGFIESWGRGFEKIRKECEEYGSPLPEVEIKNSGVMVKCVPSKVYMELLDKMKGKNGPANDPVNDPVNLDEIERKILEIIKDNASITRKDLSKLLYLSETTIKRKLSNLKQHNIIERLGSDKKGSWRIL
ncbi:MAG: ATP-binding protein [Christensenellales bacterium]